MSVSIAASRMEHFSVVSSFTNGFRGFDLSTSSVVMGGGGGSAASCDLSFNGLNKPTDVHGGLRMG